MPYRVTWTWIPDAFVGLMRSVMEASARGGIPATSRGENFATLALVEAL